MLAREINYSRLPEHMREPIRLYIEEGHYIGDFLTALLSNNLMESFGQADEKNRAAMWEWCQFLYNEAPTQCHGSPGAVKFWQKVGGLKGLLRTGPGVCADCGKPGAIRTTIPEGSDGGFGAPATERALCVSCREELGL